MKDSIKKIKKALNLVFSHEFVAQQTFWSFPTTEEMSRAEITTPFLSLPFSNFVLLCWCIPLREKTFWKHTESIKTYGKEVHLQNTEKEKPSSSHRTSWQCAVMPCEDLPGSKVHQQGQGCLVCKGYCFQSARFALRAH